EAQGEGGAVERAGDVRPERGPARHVYGERHVRARDLLAKVADDRRRLGVIGADGDRGDEERGAFILRHHRSAEFVIVGEGGLEVVDRGLVLAGERSGVFGGEDDEDGLFFRAGEFTQELLDGG